MCDSPNNVIVYRQTRPMSNAVFKVSIVNKNATCNNTCERRDHVRANFILSPLSSAIGDPCDWVISMAM
jgi:hypothetical protein